MPAPTRKPASSVPVPTRAKPPGRSLDARGQVDADERAADSVKLKSA
ncbi:MAG: hypothetical protein ACLPX8_02785 [Bryobacteraceae bacterium]|jgi:hypothetical protein